MNTRTRQDEMVRLLRRRGSSTVADLTASLSVSRRTVLRDIADLREQGFSIRTSSGPGGGIQLDPTSILLSPKLTSAEVFALLISVAVIKETHSIPFAHLADAGLMKIEQSLPRDRVLELQRILACIYIGRPRFPVTPSADETISESLLPVFETCFLRAQRMQFRYTDRHGLSTERMADPHAMLVLTPYWYLVGYDPEKRDFRHFRMDRIDSATALHTRFQRRAFTLEEGECPFSRFRFGDGTD